MNTMHHKRYHGAEEVSLPQRLDSSLLRIKFRLCNSQKELESWNEEEKNFPVISTRENVKSKILHQDREPKHLDVRLKFRSNLRIAKWTATSRKLSNGYIYQIRRFRIE